MFFQAILCINFSQPKRKEANRKDRWHPRASTWDRTDRRTSCSTAQTPAARVNRQWQQFDASSNTLCCWRDSLAMGFFLQTVTTKEKWFQKLGDVFPMQPQSSRSLSKTVSLFHLSQLLSQTCLLPAGFSQPYTNLQFVFLLHTRSLCILFPCIPLLQHLDSVLLQCSAKGDEKERHWQKVRKIQRDPQWPNSVYAQNCRGKCVQPLLPWWERNILWVVRVLCCQQSI